MTPEAIIAAARIAADLLLALVPHNEARELLDSAAAKRANAIADAAEAAKFGSSPTEPA